MLTATLFNQHRDPVSGQTAWFRTILSGARSNGGPAIHWEHNKASNVVASGLATADAVNIMIWFTVQAEGKRYLPPKQYAALSPAAAKQHWTLAEQDRMAKGTVPDVPIKEVVAAYDAVTITSIDTMDYGSPAMHHWEVAAK